METCHAFFALQTDRERHRRGGEKERKYVEQVFPSYLASQMRSYGSAGDFFIGQVVY